MFFEPSIQKDGNTLISGHNLLVMQKLLDEGYADQFQLIYFDGPFSSGRIFSMPHPKLEIELVNPWYELETMKQFLDPQLYHLEYRKRLQLARELLRDDGFLVLQTNQKECHYLKILLDELFGRENFLAEVIWKVSEDIYPNRAPFGKQHENILFYSKSDRYYQGANQVYSSIWDDVGYYETLGEENTNYPSQKPQKLMERIISATTREGDLVGDFYCGSGTFPYVASSMGRKWVSCDQSQSAIQTTRKRLSQAEVPFQMSTLVEGFNEEHYHSRIYRKLSPIPVSSYELQSLNLLTDEEYVTVHAIHFSSDVDLVNENMKFIFYYSFPLIDSDGIHEEIYEAVARPIPVISAGEYELIVPDPFEWVLYNILHVTKNEQRNGYTFEWDQIQEKVKSIVRNIDNDWIDSVIEGKDYSLIIDVFGYSYMIEKLPQRVWEVTYQAQPVVSI